MKKFDLYSCVMDRLSFDIFDCLDVEMNFVFL